MNESEITKILEQFSQKNEPAEGQVKVTQVPDYKSVYIEQIGKIGRSIILNEYKVAGKTYRAGYSSQSDTVFVSRASRD
jgi:hypothetical protein